MNQSADSTVSLWPNDEGLGPVTDLYQITMMAGYRVAGIHHGRATFEMFVRRLPKGRSFLVFAGLEQAVGDLLNLSFSHKQVDYLRGLPAFSHIPSSFFDVLESVRFRGDLWSVPEGTVVFAGEPLVRVEANLEEAQWIESYLLASIGYPTLVASKAARMVCAAAGRRLFDFGLRRGHGPQAGMLAARSSYLVGFDGTSNVEAARRLGIPCTGTMAHSWVQSFQTELDAFQAYARAFPDSTTLLVDTYDTLGGVRNSATITPPVRAIRIDSGNLGELAREARLLLDASDRASTQILGSGDLDEFAIQNLVKQGAPLDGFGVGTELITSRDAPALSLVYKLVELNGEGRIKLSAGKKTYPFGKQAFRQSDAVGTFTCDVVTKADETTTGIPLLTKIIADGKLVQPLPGLNEIRARCRAQLASLPPALRLLESTETYPIAYSDRLENEARRLGVKN